MTFQKNIFMTKGQSSITMEISEISLMLIDFFSMHQQEKKKISMAQELTRIDLKKRSR